MKPFYRVLTYLVLVVQSFVILFLLANKQQDDNSRTVVCKAKQTTPKLAGKGVQYRWELAALPTQLLFFRLHYCKR